ncbi:hypothetical protein BH11PSE8_BH11PSE8_43960 [soil metagenome]
MCAGRDMSVCRVAVYSLSRIAFEFTSRIEDKFNTAWQ